MTKQELIELELWRMDAKLLNINNHEERKDYIKTKAEEILKITELNK